MKPIRFYMDEAANRGLVKNDSDLARKLGVSRQSVSAWRTGDTAPNEDQAAALADLLGKPEIMAECMAARAKPGPHRAAWERLAKLASMKSASALTLIIAMTLTSAVKEADASTTYQPKPTPFDYRRQYYRLRKRLTMQIAFAVRRLAQRLNAQTSPA